MLSRLFRRIDWRYALGEVVIVTVGVLLALWVNNWDGRRKARAVEMETLTELHEALTSDLDRTRMYLRVFGEAQQSTATVLTHLQGDLPYADTLDFHFGRAIMGTTFTPNTAAYETLKSQGLQTISNDSLRLAVARLYDVRYEHLERVDLMVQRQFENTLQPAYIGRFRGVSFMDGYSASPIDYEALVDDVEFQGALEFSRLVRGFTLPQFQNLAAEIEALRDAIAEERGGGNCELGIVNCELGSSPGRGRAGPCANLRIPRLALRARSG